MYASVSLREQYRAMEQGKARMAGMCAAIEAADTQNNFSPRVLGGQKLF